MKHARESFYFSFNIFLAQLDRVIEYCQHPFHLAVSVLSVMIIKTSLN